MKKLGLILSLGLVFLSSCGLIPAKERVVSKPAATSSQVKESSTEPIVERTFRGQLDGVEREDKIRYQGQKLLSLDLKMLGNLPANLEEQAESQSLEDLRANFNAALNQSPEYQEAKNLEGVNLSYNITDDGRLETMISLDIDKIDAEKMANLSIFKDIQLLKTIKTISPASYISALEASGMVE